MKCKNCGTMFDEGIFCPECGTKYVSEEIKVEACISNKQNEEKKVEQQKNELETNQMMQKEIKGLEKKAVQNAEKKTNVMGIVSLVLGIIGFFTTFIVVGIILDILGFFIGIIAVIQKGKKKVAAAIGTILSLLGIILFLAICGMIISESVKETSQNESEIAQYTGEIPSNEIESDSRKAETISTDIESGLNTGGIISNETEIGKDMSNDSEEDKSIKIGKRLILEDGTIGAYSLPYFEDYLNNCDYEIEGLSTLIEKYESYINSDYEIHKVLYHRSLWVGDGGYYQVISEDEFQTLKSYEDLAYYMGDLDKDGKPNGFGVLLSCRGISFKASYFGTDEIPELLNCDDDFKRERPNLTSAIEKYCVNHKTIDGESYTLNGIFDSNMIEYGNQFEHNNLIGSVESVYTLGPGLEIFTVEDIGYWKDGYRDGLSIDCLDYYADNVIFTDEQIKSSNNDLQQFLFDYATPIEGIFEYKNNHRTFILGVDYGYVQDKIRWNVMKYPNISNLYKDDDTIINRTR